MNYHKGLNESERKDGNFIQNSNAHHVDKKNKFNYEYNKWEKYKHCNRDNKFYNMNSTNNYNNDSKISVSGSKENNFLFFNNNINDGGAANNYTIRSNAEENFTRRNFTAKMGNVNNYSNSLFTNGIANNYNKNLAFVNNMATNKAIAHATYCNGVNSFVSNSLYNQPNYPVNSNNIYHTNYNKQPNQLHGNNTATNNYTQFNPYNKVNDKNNQITSTTSCQSQNTSSLKENVLSSLPNAARTQIHKLKITDKV